MLGRPWPAPGEPLFLQEDTAWAIALHEQRQAEAAEKCPLCGLPVAVCRDPDNQFRFAAASEQCHATYAIASAQAKDKAKGEGSEASVRATAWSARMRPPAAASRR